MATPDPDTMYYHQAMKEPDREHFKESVQKEIEDHEHNHHWEITPMKRYLKTQKY